MKNKAIGQRAGAQEKPDLDVPLLGRLGKVRRGHEHGFAIDDNALRVKAGPLVRGQVLATADRRTLGEVAGPAATAGSWKRWAKRRTISASAEVSPGPRCTSRNMRTLQLWQGLHPVGQSREDVLSLVDGVSGDQDRFLGMGEKLPHDNAGVAIGHAGGLRAGCNQVDRVFQCWPL